MAATFQHTEYYPDGHNILLAVYGILQRSNT